MARLLNDRSAPELTRELGELGLSPAESLRVFAHVHRRGAAATLEAAELPGLRRGAARALASPGLPVGRLEIVSRRTSAADGFMKVLFRLPDGKPVEAVRIPLPAGPDRTPEKFIVCVSSQTGCALGCAFCATARIPAARNLAAWEMVEQVARIRDEAPAPVRGVVFMGMGEPFLNYDAVLRAARIFSHPAGFAISQKAITISTAGIVPAIRRFTAERERYRLIISLTSAIEEKRRRLMPIARRYPLAEVLEAARDHARARRDRVTLAYVAISGVNLGEEDAQALVERLRGIPVRLNLIEVNETTGEFRAPTREDMGRFRAALAALGAPIVRRYSGGKEIAAACGMLVAEP